MKSTGQRINIISDPLIISGHIEVKGTADQIFNPSRNEWIPNRQVSNNEVVLTAVLSGYDPNNGATPSINSVVWTVNGNQLSSYKDGDFVSGKDVSGNYILTCTANGAGNSAFNINAEIGYTNPTTGSVNEKTSASVVLTTTLNDAEELVLTPTTVQDGLYNPLRGEGGRYTSFGCKLMGGNKQTPAVYKWYVVTYDDSGTKIETQVNGSEPWFRGGRKYTYVEDENGIIDDSKWGKEYSIDPNSWGIIDIDLDRTDNVTLAVKAGPAWAGESSDSVEDTLQLRYRASREFPLLKQVNMHATQGYIAKPSADPTANSFKAHARVFVGSEEYNGSVDEQKAILEKYYNIVWYKTLNNVKTSIGYGATLDITYDQLGIKKSQVGETGVYAIDASTIPSIHVEVEGNYLTGGVQGAVYSNYQVPNPKAILGTGSIADELAGYLVTTSYDADGVANVTYQRLMANNWFRYENGQPAPTMVCSAQQWYDIQQMVAAYDENNEIEGGIIKNNLGELTYLGIPVACYFVDPTDKEVDIMYGWAEEIHTIELHCPSTEAGKTYDEEGDGEMICYFAKEPFEVTIGSNVISSTPIPPTLVCPSLPTLHNNKFRCIFSMPGSGFGSNGSKGIDGVSTPFYDEDYAWVACGISNLTNNTYGFAKNYNASEDNTPYAPLMHWYHNNILCALEQKFGSAILHDESMFGAGISSNLAFTETEQTKRSGVRLIKTDNTTTYHKFNSQLSGLYYKTSDGTLTDASAKYWNEALSSERAKMICLEPQLVISWACEQKYGFGIEYNKFDLPLAYSYGTSSNAYTLYGKGFSTYTFDTMSAIVCRYSLFGSSRIALYDASGNVVSSSVSVYAQMSCVHGIDLVSADVYQNQNGIESILTVTQGGQNADGEPRQIYYCKVQENLYRSTETTVGSGETYAFETDGTYELVADKGEAQETTGYGHNFIKGTCIPKTKGGGLKNISGYYYPTNYGNTTEGNRNRMGFRCRGYARLSLASARHVIASSAVSFAASASAGGFQIKLPERS